MSSSDFVELSTQPSIMRSLRAIAAAKSTTTSPVDTPCAAAVRRQVGDACRRPQRLRRPAAAVEAGAADLVLLDDGDPFAVG